MNYFNKYFIRIIISVLLFVPFVNAYDTSNLMEQQSVIKVTLLGTGYPLIQFKQFSQSTLVEVGNEKYLIDCGRGAAIRLSQIGASFSKIDKLLLTHLHSDHIVGIPDLWLSGWIQGPRTNPFKIWGPKGTKSMMDYLQKAYEFDIHIRRDIDEKLPADGIKVLVEDISEGVILENDSLKIIAFEVDHHPLKPAFGFRLNYKGYSVAFSGDTRPCENLLKHCMGVDLMVHEGASPDWFRKKAHHHTKQQIQAILDHHTMPTQAGEIFKKLKPRLAVYSHIENEPEAANELISKTRQKYSGPVLVGQDLRVIEIGPKIIVTLGSKIIYSSEQ